MVKSPELKWEDKVFIGSMVLLGILWLLVGYAHATNISIEEQGQIIKFYSPTNQTLVHNVWYWVDHNIRYENSPYNWNVNSTDIVWQNRFGDCSERALMFDRLLSPYMKTKLVHGYIGKVLHDTVKVYYEDTWQYVDNADRIGFVETGIGLNPEEKLIK